MTEEKNKGGRPTDYNDKTVEKARKYIASCKDEGKEVNLPTSEGLALFLKVTRMTLYNWAEKHKEFLYILEELNQEQAKRLINKGLSGDYNSNIAKLVLAKHGYKDKSEQDITSKGESITGINYIVPKENEDNNKTDLEATPGVEDTGGQEDN